MYWGRVKHVRGTSLTLVTPSLAFLTEMLVISHWEEERLGSSYIIRFDIDCSEWGSLFFTWVPAVWVLLGFGVTCLWDSASLLWGYSCDAAESQ